MSLDLRDDEMPSQMIIKLELEFGLEIYVNFTLFFRLHDRCYLVHSENCSYCDLGTCQ